MRIAHVLAIALIGVSLTHSVHAKDASCEAATKLTTAMAKRLPIEVDAVTRTTSVEVSCHKRQVQLLRTVELKQSRMNEFRDYLQKQDNGSVCPDKSRRALVDAGWKWMTTYTFQDGAPVTITVACAK